MTQTSPLSPTVQYKPETLTHILYRVLLYVKLIETTYEKLHFLFIYILLLLHNRVEIIGK